MPSRGKNPPHEKVTRPRLGWRAGRLLVPSAWQTRDPEWRQQLVTLAEPGQVGPLARLGWSMAVTGLGAQPGSTVDLTAHGFCVETPGGPRAVGWMAAAGLLVMDLPPEAKAELHADDLHVERTGNLQVLETAEGVVGLLVQPSPTGWRAVMGNRAVDQRQLVELMENWAGEDSWLRWQESQEPLADFWAVQRAEPAADLESRARAVDDLEAGLRQPAGELAYPWMLGHTAEGEGQVTDHLYAQVRAWSMLHPPTAAALVKAVLSTQRENGTIPRLIRPDGFHDSQWMPLPLLARSAWVAWQAKPNREFHDYVMPRLQRYLEWAIGYFDPEWLGLPRWQDARESWIPELYDITVASADLPALLISELDALRDLAQAVSSGGQPLEALMNYRAGLGRTLTSYFWNKEQSRFHDRIVGAQHVARLTLSATLPLLDTTLPRDTLHPVAEPLDREGSLRGTNGIQDWMAWPDEPVPPLSRDGHQLLVFDALNGAGETLMAQRLREDLAARPKDAAAGRLEAEAAALQVVVYGCAPEITPDFAVLMPVLGWMDQHRKLVAWATLAPLALLLTGVIAGFILKRRLTVQAAETSLGLAQRLYAEQRYEESYQLLRDIVDSGRTFQGLQFRLGNTEFRRGQLAEAEAAYRAELAQNPNAVESSLNLALTLLHAGRPDEAKDLYATVTNRFHQAAPEMAKRAALALELMDRAALYLPTPGPVAADGEKE